jgi:hypothetical protein
VDKGTDPASGRGGIYCFQKNTSKQRKIMKRLKSMRETLGLHFVGGLIVAVLICVVVGDLKAGDYWLPVAGSDCQVWSDEPLAMGEIIRWSGRCHAGKLSGSGVLEVFEGDKRKLRFEGTMQSGRAEGPGKVEVVGKNGTGAYSAAKAASVNLNPTRASLN